MQDEVDFKMSVHGDGPVLRLYPVKRQGRRWTELEKFKGSSLRIPLLNLKRSNKECYSTQ